METGLMSDGSGAPGLSLSLSATRYESPGEPGASLSPFWATPPPPAEFCGGSFRVVSHGVVVRCRDRLTGAPRALGGAKRFAVRAALAGSQVGSASMRWIPYRLWSPITVDSYVECCASCQLAQ